MKKNIVLLSFIFWMIQAESLLMAKKMQVLTENARFFEA